MVLWYGTTGECLTKHKDHPIWHSTGNLNIFQCEILSEQRTRTRLALAADAGAAALVTKINHFRQIETPRDGTLGDV